MIARPALAAWFVWLLVVASPALADQAACAIDDLARARVVPAAPSLPKATLRSFGAAGDDRTDDTKALRAAFAARGVCLDGEGRTYRVEGTLRAYALCLSNATLRQTAEPMDTRPFIRSTERKPPKLTAADRVLYPEDKGLLTDEQHRRLNALNNLRTILVTADGRNPVFLSDLKVLKGAADTLGSAGEAAGIYVDGATSLTMRNVEVTGQGRGNGVTIVRSSHVRLSRLDIHDLTWSLTPGDRRFTLEEMRSAYRWNDVPIYVYDAKARQFAQVRSQEQANGLVVMKSDDVIIADSKIDGVLYRSSEGLIPWQADGMTFGAVSCLGIYDTTVSRTWEGIDLTGQWVRGFRIRNVALRNSHAFGLKLVHGASDGVVDGLTVSHAGLSGVVVAGPVRDVLLNDVAVDDTGVLPLAGRRALVPWRGLPGDLGVTAAVSVGGNGEGRPERIGLSSARIEGGQEVLYGVRIDRAPPMALSDVAVSGARTRALAGAAPSALTFADVASLYRDAAGCEGELRILRDVWLDSQGAVSRRQVAARLSREKAARGLACAVR